MSQSYKKAMEVFCVLMVKGWIERRENLEAWQNAADSEVLSCLESMGDVFRFDIFPVRDRIYMIPKQDNTLFLKNNIDYRRDIRADSSVRKRDLYLMNYLSIYLIYTFFGGEGKDPLCRNFISKEDFISLFTQHCKSVESDDLTGEEDGSDYSANFHQLVQVWLSKIDGEPTSQKFDTKYGVLNRILIKYREDDLFFVTEDDLIQPTMKMKDLMPYFLRKDRIADIHDWMKEEDKYAASN